MYGALTGKLDQSRNFDAQTVTAIHCGRCT